MMSTDPFRNHTEMYSIQFQPRTTPFDVPKWFHADPAHIAQTNDIKALQQFLPSLVYARIDQSIESRLPDQLLAKLFRYSQLYVEYLVAIQNQLHQRLTKRQEKLKQLQQAYKTKQAQQREKEKKSTTKLKSLDRSIKGYRALLAHLRLEANANQPKPPDTLVTIPQQKKTRTTNQQVTLAPIPKRDDGEIERLRKQQEDLASELAITKSLLQQRSHHRPAPLILERPQPRETRNNDELRALRDEMTKQHGELADQRNNWLNRLSDYDKLFEQMRQQHLDSIELLKQRLSSVEATLAILRSDTDSTRTLAENNAALLAERSNAGKLISDEPMQSTSVQTEPVEEVDWRSIQSALQGQIDELWKALRQEQARNKSVVEEKIVYRPTPVHTTPPVEPPHEKEDLDALRSADLHYQQVLLGKVLLAWHACVPEKPLIPLTEKEEPFTLTYSWQPLLANTHVWCGGSGYETIADVLENTNGRNRRIIQTARASFTILDKNNCGNWATILPVETMIRVDEHGKVHVKCPNEWSMTIPTQIDQIHERADSTFVPNKSQVIHVTRDMTVERICAQIQDILMKQIPESMWCLSRRFVRTIKGEQVVAGRHSRVRSHLQLPTSFRLPTDSVFETTSNVHTNRRSRRTMEQTSFVDPTSGILASHASVEETNMFVFRPIVRVCLAVQDEDIEELIVRMKATHASLDASQLERRKTQLKSIQALGHDTQDTDALLTNLRSLREAYISQQIVDPIELASIPSIEISRTETPANVSKDVGYSFWPHNDAREMEKALENARQELITAAKNSMTFLESSSLEQILKSTFSTMDMETKEQQGQQQQERATNQDHRISAVQPNRPILSSSEYETLQQYLQNQNNLLIKETDNGHTLPSQQVQTLIQSIKERNLGTATKQFIANRREEDWPNVDEFDDMLDQVDILRDDINRVRNGQIISTEGSSHGMTSTRRSRSRSPEHHVVGFSSNVSPQVSAFSIDRSDVDRSDDTHYKYTRQDRSNQKDTHYNQTSQYQPQRIHSSKLETSENRNTSDTMDHPSSTHSSVHNIVKDTIDHSAASTQSSVKNEKDTFSVRSAIFTPVSGYVGTTHSSSNQSSPRQSTDQLVPSSQSSDQFVPSRHSNLQQQQQQQQHQQQRHRIEDRLSNAQSRISSSKDQMSQIHRNSIQEGNEEDEIDQFKEEIEQDDDEVNLPPPPSAPLSTPRFQKELPQRPQQITHNTVSDVTETIQENVDEGGAAFSADETEIDDLSSGISRKQPSTNLYTTTSRPTYTSVQNEPIEILEHTVDDIHDQEDIEQNQVDEDYNRHEEMTKLDEEVVDINSQQQDKNNDQTRVESSDVLRFRNPSHSTNVTLTEGTLARQAAQEAQIRRMHSYQEPDVVEDELVSIDDLDEEEL